MKVVLINGSPHRKGNTFIALSEVAGALEKEGVQTEIIQLGIKAVQGCIACNKCAELGHCVFQDTLYNQVREALQEADGIVRRYIMPVRTGRSVHCSTGCFIPVRNCWLTKPELRWLFVAGVGRVPLSTG
jgi:hypothetical protein